MNVTVENVAACRKKLKIEVPSAEVAREWKGVVTEFQKFAQIPGFRVGKAPPNVLERKYSKEIEAEVQRKLIPQYFREAIAKEKIKMVSAPSIDEVTFSRTEPLRFGASVDVAPEFPLPTYKGLKVKKTKVELKDEEVENALTMLAEQQANFEDVKDRGLILGDFAVISYRGTIDGKPIVEVAAAAKPLSENNQFWLLMAKDSFVPGFCEPLVGLKTAEKKDVSVTFPAEFRIKELSGQKADYSVELLGIKEKKLPPLDDAFAVQYKSASIDELRKKVRDNMLRERERQAEGDVKNQLVTQLLAATTFELPESLVAAEAQQTVMDIVRENQRRGFEENDIREKGKEIFDFAQTSAKDKVKASFILTRIAEEEKIQVKDEEVIERLAATAQQMGRSLEEVKRKMEENGEIESVREQILIGHTLEKLLSMAESE